MSICRDVEVILVNRFLLVPAGTRSGGRPVARRSRLVAVWRGWCLLWCRALRTTVGEHHLAHLDDLSVGEVELIECCQLLTVYVGFVGGLRIVLDGSHAGTTRLCDGDECMDAAHRIVLACENLHLCTVLTAGSADGVLTHHQRIAATFVFQPSWLCTRHIVLNDGGAVALSRC